MNRHKARRKAGERVPKILVVDDDGPIREMVGEVLTDAGYAVALARDGAEALVQIEAERPDLVLSDVTMPSLDGRGVLAAVRTRGMDVPFILMSADDRMLERQDAPTIRKPIDLDHLLALVAHQIDERDETETAP